MNNAKGFTLIELLVVIVILSILGTYVGVKLMNKPDEARQTQARTQIGALENALKMYRLDNGTYPSQEQGLSALVEKPSTGTIPRNWREGGYLDKTKLPKDPWGNDFIYVNPGIRNPSGIDIMSYGADGQPGGEGFDADLGNWDAGEAPAQP
ncbi:MAG: Type II secretion system protein G precursor [Deltaproteobacteria bacterium ADurb.Bin510]|nr:MAG: Type II secretion system protein G precursor [Deltaproteobacteria bacterium ADurb.Bin510]